MRRASTLLVLLALVAFGCDLGATCAMAMAEGPDPMIGTMQMAQHDDSCCCCPTTCTGPCMEDEDEAPQPPEPRATLDGPSAPAMLASAPAVARLPVPTRGPGSVPLADPTAGEGPSIFLLACSFLN